MTAKKNDRAHYSFSRLSAFYLCPGAYKLEYIDRKPTRLTDPIAIGGVAHDFFEAYDRHLMQTRQSSDHAGAEKIIPKVWGSFERVLHPSLYDQYAEICREFYRNHVLDLDVVVGVEEQIALTKELAVTGWNAEDVWFRSKIDRLDITADPIEPESAIATITDYKTGWSSQADPFQIELYALAVSKAYPQVKRFISVLYYVRSGYEDRRAIGPERLETTEKLLREYVAGMERAEAENRYPFTPGKACPTCCFASRCKAKDSGIARLRKKAEAAKVAQDVMVLEAKLADKKDALRAWGELNGSVAVNGVTFGVTMREEYKVIDPNLLVKALMKARRDPTEFYSLDTSALKKACRKDPELADAVAGAIYVETKPIWGHRQTYADPEKEQAHEAKNKEHRAAATADIPLPWD